MSWIEVHDTLPDHPKVVEFASLLNIDRDAAVGKLVRFWTWAITNRETGLIFAGDASTIADVMRITRNKGRVIETLVNARLLDVVDGGWQIHDWDERVGMLLAKREKVRAQARERQRRLKERKRGLSGEKEVVGKKPRKVFEKPTIDEVRAYCAERKNGIDPQKFIDHYTSNGWRVGKVPMQDWKAAVRTWEKGERQDAPPKKEMKMFDVDEYLGRK